MYSYPFSNSKSALGVSLDCAVDCDCGVEESSWNPPMTASALKIPKDHQIHHPSDTIILADIQENDAMNQAGGVK